MGITDGRDARGGKVWAAFRKRPFGERAGEGGFEPNLKDAAGFTNVWLEEFGGFFFDRLLATRASK